MKRYKILVIWPKNCQHDLCFCNTAKNEFNESIFIGFIIHIKVPTNSVVSEINQLVYNSLCKR